MKKLNLKLNEQKSIAIIMGSKKQTKDLIDAIKEAPIMCGEVEVKVKDADKWLGQQLASGGLGESVAATIYCSKGG